MYQIPSTEEELVLPTKKWIQYFIINFFPFYFIWGLFFVILEIFRNNDGGFLFHFLKFCLPGSIIGFVQLLIFRVFIYRTNAYIAWVLYSTLVLPLVLAVFSTSISVQTWIFVGFLTSIGQWSVLKRYIINSHIWIVIVMILYISFGVSVGFILFPY